MRIVGRVWVFLVWMVAQLLLIAALEGATHWLGISVWWGPPAFVAIVLTLACTNRLTERPLS